MDLGLKGKVAIVTGGAHWGNIGGAICRTLGEEGVNIVIADIDEVAGNDAVGRFKTLGTPALFVKTDVSNVENVSALAKAAKSEFGAIDILVNTAAYLGEVGKPFIQETPEGRKRETDVILHGTFNCTRAVLDHMIEQKKGSIVNVLSDAARIGEPMQVGYGAAKAGVAGFTRGIAAEVGRYNIRANCVSPSMTRTEAHMQRRERQKLEMGEEKFADMEKKRLKLYPLGRLGEIQDIANAVVFLASDRASWVTGQTLSVNGGYAIAW